MHNTPFCYRAFISRRYVTSCLRRLSSATQTIETLGNFLLMLDIRGDSSAFNHPIATVLRTFHRIPNARVYNDFCTYTILFGLITRKVRLTPLLIDFNRVSYKYPQLFGMPLPLTPKEDHHA